MNAVVKYLLTDFVVKSAGRGAVRVFEAVVATVDPKKHEAYVDFIVEKADARLEAFVARNQHLASEVAAKSGEVKEHSEEALQQMQEVLSPLLDFLKEPKGNGKSD